MNISIKIFIYIIISVIFMTLGSTWYISKRIKDNPSSSINALSPLDPRIRRHTSSSPSSSSSNNTLADIYQLLGLVPKGGGGHHHMGIQVLKDIIQEHGGNPQLLQTTTAALPNFDAIYNNGNGQLIAVNFVADNNLVEKSTRYNIFLISVPLPPDSHYPTIKKYIENEMIQYYGGGGGGRKEE